MNIQLKNLPHQMKALKAINAVFKDVHIAYSDNVNQNPIIDLKDLQLVKNIENIWEGNLYEDMKPIPHDFRRSILDDILGIDVRMETGTGKTYVYTRMMYELHENYGFNKFIILVPSTPIKEGTSQFIQSKYARVHFNDIYKNKTINLNVLNAQKTKTNGRKMFPVAISEFVRGSRLEKNRIHVLLMSDSMLLSKKTMEKDDYDQTLFGSLTQPYKALREVKPIVIIDEPHRFKRENKAFKCIEEELQPQCIIRYGATFPEISNTDNNKDYNNLIYNLGSCEAFNEQLVKGVEVGYLNKVGESDCKIKLMDIISRPKTAVFRNENTKKSFSIELNENLNIIDNDFSNISIDSIGKDDEFGSVQTVRLSNGHVLKRGDVIYSSIYGTTYQELMIKLALDRHFEKEKENFLRKNRIKTLALFFIDSVYSYRGKDNDGDLKKTFERLLSEKIKSTLQLIDDEIAQGFNLVEYKEYLLASLDNIKATNGGYFAEDNSKADEDIKNEVEKILREKEKLLSFYDEKGNYNTLRFIFSKWTLREGWDNPNVFTIAKLRSSGSEISKLQEVGRGLRLPVDEKGNRVSDEQFYLNYIIDYSEKAFASNLINEINSENIRLNNVKDIFKSVAEERGVTEKQLFIELYAEDYIDTDYNIVAGKREDFIQKYPEFNKGLKSDKVIDTSKKSKSYVEVRKDNFNKISELWKEINQKYFISFDDVKENELLQTIVDMLKKGIYTDQTISSTRIYTEKSDAGVRLKQNLSDTYIVDGKLPYNEFLKRIQNSTSIPINIMHKAIVEYSKETKIKSEFFNSATLNSFIVKFNEWREKNFIQRFSYCKLDVEVNETALTYSGGKVKEKILQTDIGVHKADINLPSKFLYNTFVYDSDKEMQNIAKSERPEVVVFGKIPRRSIKIPLYYGGTTSPDFMYVLKKTNGDYTVNFIVETKDIKQNRGMRDDEQMRIASAKVFFEQLKKDGVNVEFQKQLKEHDIVTMINDLLK